MGKDYENDYLYIFLLLSSLSLSFHPPRLNELKLPRVGKDDDDEEEGDNNLDEQWQC